MDTLPGGFNQTVIEWTENLDYNILTVSAERIFDVITNADACVINMYAMDHGKPDKPPDARYYDVIRPDRAGSLSLGGLGENGDGGSSTPGGGSSTPGAGASSSSAVSARFAVLVGIAAFLFNAF